MPVACAQIRSGCVPTNNTYEARPATAGHVMSSRENVPPDAVPVPMKAMLDGTEGTPFESIAQTPAHRVMSAGSDPPVVLCEIDPMPGAPAPVALNSLTGSLPVRIRLASALPSASVVYS